VNPTSIDTLSMFSKSCGAGSLHLNFLEADGRVGEQRSFDPPFFVVGRSPDADLRLDHDHVSWRHCYLQVIGGRLVAIDLESQSGVLIDGVPQRIGWVTPANRLQIGPVSLRFQGQAGDGDDRGAETGGESRMHPLSAQYARDLPPAVLEIAGAGGPTYGWRMSRALALIGRSTACQVRLMNPSVSTFHAALVRTPSGVWIVDLLSREGIEVDGANVRAARLEEGRVCRVGSFTLRLCSGTLAPAPPRRPDRSRSLPAPSVPHAGNVSPSPEGRSVLLATPAGGASPLPLAPAWSSNSRGDEPDLRPTWNPAAPGAESTQQAMMMLAQMLGTMHRDHMSLVKDELAEIRKLAEEMHALRVEIGQRPAEALAVAPREPSVAPAPLVGMASPDPARPAKAAAVGKPAPGDDPVEAGPAMSRDPKECLAIASQFLAAYERKQEGHWSRILRMVTGMSRGQDPGRGPLEQAPLG
jgi:pSer/pThr/pTyr-binding forkhead associated (FHA) protein